MDADDGPTALNSAPTPYERKRQTQACDTCRVKKRKCDGARPACTTCLKLATREGGEPECTYVSLTKKRGPQKGYQSKLLTRLNQLESILKQSPPSTSTVAEPACVSTPLSNPFPLLLQPASQSQPLQQQPLPPLQSNPLPQPTPVPHVLPLLLQPSPLAPSIPPEVPQLPSQTQSFASPPSSSTVSPASQFSSNSGGSPDNSCRPERVTLPTREVQQMQIGLGRAQAVAAEAAGMVWSSPNSGPLAGLPPVDSNQLQMMQNLDIWSWTGDEPFPFSSMFDDSIFSGLPMQSPASTMRENLLQTAVLLNNATGVILPHLLPFPNTPANDTPLTLAACATATPISAHPELLGKHGTREQAAHVYVLRAEEALLNRKSDSVETVLAMLMMAGMAYSLDQGWKAHKWIAEAHLTCERHLYNCTNIHQLTIRSLLKDPKSAAHKPFEPSPEQREDRRMAWIASIIYATYCAMASGLPAGIEESDYVELLYEGRAWEDGFAQGRAPVEERNAKRVNAMKGLLPVRHSIFEDYCGAQHGYLEFASQTSGPDTRLLQICFLVRRVLRLINRPCGVNNSRPGDAEDEGIMRGTGAVLGVLGNAADERMIHDAVVEWHGSLSPDERVFESLGIFRDGQVLTTHETPPRWVHNPATVHNILLFLYAICLLHMPREGTELGAGMGVGASFRFGSNHYSVLPTPQFRIDTTTAPPIRVPSSEILTLARRAMVYLLRTIHTYTRPSFHPPDFIPLSPAKLGDGNNGAGTGLCFTPFDPSCPAPPMSLVWPVMSTHCINVVALACLAGVRRREGISGGAGNGQSNGGAGGFAVDNIVNPPSFGIGDGKRGSYQSVETREVGNDIRMVLLPVLDNLSRVWPMGRRYAARVRQTAYELFGE